MDQEEFHGKVIDGLARLDEKMTSLVGNGQPGRVGRLEEDVEELKKARWTVGGAVIGVSTAASSLVHFLFHK